MSMDLKYWHVKNKYEIGTPNGQPTIISSVILLEISLKKTFLVFLGVVVLHMFYYINMMVVV